MCLSRCLTGGYPTPRQGSGRGGGGGGGGRLCGCWCQGWAEVLVRRPSGNMAWMTRIENRQLVESDELPVPDLLSLIAPGTADQDMERLLKQVCAAGRPGKPLLAAVPFTRVVLANETDV